MLVLSAIAQFRTQFIVLDRAFPSPFLPCLFSAHSFLFFFPVSRRAADQNTNGKHYNACRSLHLHYNIFPSAQRVSHLEKRGCRATSRDRALLPTRCRGALCLDPILDQRGFFAEDQALSRKQVEQKTLLYRASL